MLESFPKRSSDRPLDEAALHPDPIAQFGKWYDEAVAAQLPMAHALVLATVTKDGKPSARVVLLKDYGPRGFVFYTNYNSPKAQDLSKNPSAALVFYWTELERQVRIEGAVEKISEEESDRYFRARPRDSQISAAASEQSEVIGSREELERRAGEIEQRYQGRAVPRPLFWGGYTLKPTEIEFWQGRSARLHDRFLYMLQPDGKWVIKRLQP